ncbi:hypothetical protein KR52_03205 [Synechococcus sp. KORDI-52]|nr:hypothetical protein KR52_03205 [Synechococcus sp. KORDI-52]
MSARVPTSHAYWNLRAEQVMDQVFERETATPPAQPHLVPVDVDVHEPAAAVPDRRSAAPWLLPLMSGVALAGVICSGWVVNSLQRSRLDLERQQNVALIERLRDQLTAQEARSKERATPVDAAVAIQSLEPLTLPIQQPLPVESQTSDQTPAPIESTPKLNGIVQGPGGTSSAIFQLGQGSVSAGIGDAIGSSGWTLTAVTDSGAVISRNGLSQTLSVGGLF